MAAIIEVRIGGRGAVRAGEVTRDEATKAECDLCQQAHDVVASVSADGGAPYACKACLRTRLEAMTVGAWQLREAAERGLPWGKISG